MREPLPVWEWVWQWNLVQTSQTSHNSRIRPYSTFLNLLAVSLYYLDHVYTSHFMYYILLVVLLSIIKGKPMTIKLRFNLFSMEVATLLSVAYWSFESFLGCKSKTFPLFNIWITYSKPRASLRIYYGQNPIITALPGLTERERESVCMYLCTCGWVFVSACMCKCAWERERKS